MATSSAYSYRLPRPSRQIAWRFWRMRGWRVSVGYGALAATIVLTANIVLLIWAAVYTKYPIADAIITLFHGDCQKSKRVFTTSHVLINIMSTSLLAASNVGMQCLLAPTRADVDKAHAKGDWLHIGVLGFRNIRYIPRRRTLVCTVLALSSMPLHLLYNSVIFSSISANQYTAYFVASNFVTGDNSTVDLTRTPELLYLRGNASVLQFLSADQCRNTYSNDFVSAYSDFLMVSSTVNRTNSVLLGPNRIDMAHNVGDTNSDAEFLCLSQSSGTSLCASYGTNDWALDTNYATGIPENYAPIDHCLARTTSQECEVSLSISLMLVVIACNVLKLASFVYLLRHAGWCPLITIGDAVEEFLQHEDATTRGAPLLTFEDGRQGRWSPSSAIDAANDGCRASVGRRWEPRKKRWLSAVSPTRWAVTLLSCLVLWFTAFALVAVNAGGYNKSAIEFSQFGQIDANYVFSLSSDEYSSSGSDGSGSLVFNVLLANLPQLLVSTVYISYSGIVTCMLLSREYTQYVRRRRGLRVTKPHGGQRSTPWLSVPYRFALPITAMMAVLHWTISESIFLARVNAYDEDHNRDSSSDIDACGWSPAAVIISLIIGGCLIVSLVLVGYFMKFPVDMPVASSCSAAISSACHKSSTDSADAADKPLMYGVLPDTSVVGTRRVGYSSEPVEPLVRGEAYGEIYQLDLNNQGGLGQRIFNTLWSHYATVCIYAASKGLSLPFQSRNARFRRLNEEEDEQHIWTPANHTRLSWPSTNPVPLKPIKRDDGFSDSHLRASSISADAGLLKHAAPPGYNEG